MKLILDTHVVLWWLDDGQLFGNSVACVKLGEWQLRSKMPKPSDAHAKKLRDKTEANV